MKRCYDPSFKYTPAKEMGPDYLKRKFDAIRRERTKAQAATTAKVTALPSIKRSAR